MQHLQFIWMLLLLNFGQICSTQTQKYNVTTDVMRTLFDENRYDRRMRPFFQTDKINVTIGMSVVHFGQIREVFMDFSLDIFFYQIWYDERLKHDLKYPIVLGGQYRHLIWIPDTFFLNIRTAKFHNVPADNSKITIFSDGRVSYSTRLTLTAGCEMNLKDYPLDEQTCNLTILSYAFLAHELDYNWSGKADKAIVIINRAMNEFDLTGFQISKELYAYVSGHWTHLTATFSFKRRLGYSLIQVYAPTLLIVALSWLSFWISKDAVPARIALGVTTVLTIVTLMGSFRAQVPKVSYIKAIDLFFIMSFMFVFGAVLEYILVLFHTSVQEHNSTDDNSNDKEDVMLDVFNKKEDNLQSRNETNNDVFSPKGFRQRRTRQSKMNKTKKFVRFAFIEQNASKVDKISRFMFPLAYLLFNIVYWMYYSLGTFNSSVSLGYSNH